MDFRFRRAFMQRMRGKSRPRQTGTDICCAVTVKYSHGLRCRNLRRVLKAGQYSLQRVLGRTAPRITFRVGSSIFLDNYANTWIPKREDAGWPGF